MQGTLSDEVSKLLHGSMVADVRSKFGFKVPKDILQPLITRAQTAVLCALGNLPSKLIYTHVDQYEAELELFILDVMDITGESDDKVRGKITAAMDLIGDKLYDYVVTWKRVERINAARSNRPVQNPRKNHANRQTSRPGKSFSR